MNQSLSETVTRLRRLGAIVDRVPSLSMFSAGSLLPRSDDAVKTCAQLLSEVMRLGAAPEKIGILEEAYWDLLDSKSLSGRWETAPLFQDGIRIPDQDSIDAIVREIGAGLKGHSLAVNEEFLLAVTAAKRAAYRDGIEAAVRDGTAGLNLNIGPLLRAAGFVALAMASGVHDHNRPELRRLVYGHVIAGDLKIFSTAMQAVAHETAEGEHVRHLLGISVEEWNDGTGNPSS